MEIYQAPGMIETKGLVAAKRVVELAAVHVIPRPHGEGELVLPG